MFRRHASLWGALGLLVFAPACQPAEPSAPEGAATAPTPPVAADDEPGELAAEIDGVAIRSAELDAWIKEDLFKRNAAGAAELYELRKSALDTLIGERLIGSAAAKRGLSAEQLIEQEIAALGPVTDEEVKIFFDENEMGDDSFEDVSERIRAFLTQRREFEAQTAITEQAEVVVHLEAPRFDVPAEGPSRGPEGAPITIVEFSDFQCPFCQRVLPTLEQIMEKYPDQVRVVYRNLPLRSHSRARPAAEAALCANDQGQFWPYHDLLFENSRQLSDEDLLRYAGEVGLDSDKFQACYDEKRFAQQVSDDVAAARAVGANGTPAFFVNGVLLSGAKPPADFFRVIDAELQRLGRSG